MEKRAKWLVGITIANLACTLLLALLVYEVLQAFGAFAAYVVTWPVFVMFPICIALSILGLWLARKTGSKSARWLGYVMNALPLVVPSLILFFAGDIFFHMDRTKYIIPDGYQGYVYILHGVASGVAEEKGHWEVTYQIPSDGFLLTQDPLPAGFREANYYYQLRNGSLRRIPTADAVSPGSESEVVATPSVPQNGGYEEHSESLNCHVEYEEFHVGAGLSIVAFNETGELSAYLHAHPGVCASGSK